MVCLPPVDAIVSLMFSSASRLTTLITWFYRRLQRHGASRYVNTFQFPWLCFWRFWTGSPRETEDVGFRISLLLEVTSSSDPVRSITSAGALHCGISIETLKITTQKAKEIQLTSLVVISVAFRSYRCWPWIHQTLNAFSKNKRVE